METNSPDDTQDHFKGKDALGHLIEARKRGHTAGHEPHGIEPSGFLNGLLDSGKETTLILIFFSFFFLQITRFPSLLFLAAFALGFGVWKFGRAAFIAWSRLEKLHRVTLEEKKEIEENRETEREELKEIYRLKGFEGQLLDDVIGVLMQDDNRLLQIMLEEELGISVQCQEHPLKQGFGAFLGVLISSVCILLTLYLFSWTVALGVGFALILIFQICTAKVEKNRMVPSAVWGLGLFGVAIASSYFIVQFILGFL